MYPALFLPFATPSETMMKRSIRRALRWTLVVTLATFLSTGPVSAGWLLKRMRGCDPAPVCGDPFSSDPAPVVWCPAPEPVGCPVPACCDPMPAISMPMVSMPTISLPVESPCCGGTVVESLPMSDSTSNVGGYELGAGTSSTSDEIDDVEIVESPRLDTGSGKTSSAKPPTEQPQPATGESSGQPEVEPAVEPVEPSPFEEPTTPPPVPTPDPITDVLEPVQPEPVQPEPIEAPETDDIAPETDIDGLFGSPEPPMLETPAQPEPVQPEPATPNAIDDLFGSEPAAEPAMPAEDAAGVDDLFGSEPATEPAMPAEDAAGVDDLFGGDDGADAPAAPADEPAGIDDLFSPPADEAPATDAPAEGTGIDDLFDTPEPAMPETPANDIDDLFGEPPADGATEEPAESDVDSIFSMTPVPAATPVDTVSSAKPARTLTALDQTEQRNWVDNTGTFRTEGRLIKIADDHVKLLKSNGKTCTVPMTRLSAKDSKYVKMIADRMETFVVAMTPN